MRISDWSSDVCSSDLPVPPQTPEEEGRLQDLEIENDDLVAALETELADGTPEAEAANDRLEAIEREVDEIEAGCSAIDPGVKTRLGTFVYIGADGTPRGHARLFSEQPIREPARLGSGGDPGAGAAGGGGA